MYNINTYVRSQICGYKPRYQGQNLDISINFLNKLLLDNIIKEIKMLGNNKTSLTLTKNFRSQNHTKHIDIIYYHIHELIDDK